MNPEEFISLEVPRGTKAAVDLEVGDGLLLPVLVVRGAEAGKTLVVTAAVHGDEYEGVRAIFEVNEELDPAQMKGDLLAVPAANPPAFWNGTRVSPLDDGNLARVFPGAPNGSPTERIAYWLGKAILSRADFYLDLHSGGVKWQMPAMVGFHAHDQRAREAAGIFGANVVWAHPTVPPGRTVSFATARGIPWLYTEMRGGGRIHSEDLLLCKNGIRNLMGHLGILPTKPPRARIEWRLLGDGNIDLGLAPSRRGFFIADVALLERVRKGQSLGRLLDLHGKVMESYAAPRDGVVALVRQFPVVEPGEPLLLITEEE